MTKDERTKIARLGGLKTSQNREHMRYIGQTGGLVTQERRRVKNGEYL